MTMRYDDIMQFVSAGLSALRYNPVPILNPGPATSGQLQKLTPQAMAFLTVGSGAGPTTELLFDRPYITVRAIGLQGDFHSAENLAYDIDTMFQRVDRNTQIGNAKCLYIARTAGAPQLIDFDSADRYHFQCMYVTEAQSGI